MSNTPSMLDSRLIEVGQRNLEAASTAQKNAVERLGKIYEEGLRFMTLRLDENRKTFQEFTTCRSLPDAMPIWSAYVERTTKAYTEEFEVIANLVSEQATATLEETLQETPESVVEKAVTAPLAAATESVEAAEQVAEPVEEKSNA